MKNVSRLFLLCLWGLGCVAGTCYAIYYKVDYPIIVGMVIATLFGIPTAKRIWDKFKE
jgi:hypothetical protein